MSLFLPVFRALAENDVRYVLVGGLAVVLHGHARMTADIDLVVDLEPAAARAAIGCLSRLGLVPRISEPAERFADPRARREWTEQKGMKVFSLVDPANPLRAVDLFAEHPLPFSDLWRDSLLLHLRSVPVRVASIPHLIELKRRAGRPVDRLDIEALERLRRRADDR